MTTELEKQFFDTFGIKSEMGCTAYEELVETTADLICNDYCTECDYFKEVYPQITNKRYIELYCILCDVFNLFDAHRYPVITFRVKDFKENVLKELIQADKYYKHEYIKSQIRKLFT